MREQVEKKKPSKLRDNHHDLMVGCMVQNKEMVTQWLRLLKIETQHKTAPKSLQLGLREFRILSEILWRSPKRTNVQDLQETFRRLSEDQYKNLWFVEKKLFRSISLCVTCFCFYKKGKYSEVLNGDIPGTSTAPTCGTSRAPSYATFYGRLRV